MMSTVMEEHVNQRCGEAHLFWGKAQRNTRYSFC